MKRVAIIGAGPVGIGAALTALENGYEVRVFERDRVGGNLRRWGHVTLFSPWALNCSDRGRTLLGVTFDEAVFPTGFEYLASYLEPLAAHLPEGVLSEHSEVLSVSRAQAFKGDLIGNAERGEAPFQLLVQVDGAQRYEFADVVIDTSGAYDLANPLGAGGLPALGESNCESSIDRFVPDALGKDRANYAGKRTLVVGAGFSAITSLKGLCDLQKDAPNTELFWLVKASGEPYAVIENDSLPQRAELSNFGNTIAEGRNDGVTYLDDAIIENLVRVEDGLSVSFRRGGSAELETVMVDRVVSNTGYRPDTSITRELQVHYCYASEGTMKLAANLLAQSGGGGDCLAQVSAGADVLKSPEPNFFVLGSKSYGRNSAFLLKLGFDQVSDVFHALSES